MGIGLIFLIFIFFILPVLLIRFKIVPFKHRLNLLYSLFALTLGFVMYQSWSLKKLGIRFDNFQESIIPYFLLLVIGLIVIHALAKILKKKTMKDIWEKPHFRYGFIVLSVMQQFIFSAVLLTILRENFNNLVLVIFIYAFLFAFIHLIYANWYFSIPLVFFAGIAFATIYTFYPNLILIIIIHAILNAYAVHYKFYTFPKH